MTTEGIEAVFVETHNWGKAARFLQALGFDLELETDHNSGQLRNGDGPHVFVAEVPEDREPQMQVVLKMLALARDAGFERAHHVSGTSLAERYFTGRTDGLRPSRGEDLVVATT
jgi:hypothetical protein